MRKIFLWGILSVTTVMSLYALTNTSIQSYSDVDLPPIAINDTVAIVGNTVALINVLENDTDPEGVPLINREFAFPGFSPKHGILNYDIPNRVAYTPELNFVGQDSFFYLSCDTIQCSGAWVFVDVLPPNMPPVIDDSALSHLETFEDSTLNILVIENTTDPEDDELDITIIQSPDFGDAVVREDTIIYMPDRNYFGQDTLSYIVCDQEPLCDTMTTYIEVLPINDPPIANTDYENTGENQRFSFNPTLNDIDIDNEQVELSIEVITDPQLGSITIDERTIEYRPNKLTDGQDSLQYVVCDLEPLCDTAWVYITIDDDCDDCLILNEDESDYILTYEGYTNPLITFTNTYLIRPPLRGSVTISADTIKYKPFANFDGQDFLTYVVCDTEPQCDTVRMCIYVLPINDKPEAFDDKRNIDEEIAKFFDPTVNDIDVDNDPLELIIITPPSKGVITDERPSEFYYIPYFNETGPDSIQYAICDEEPLCDTAWMRITINPVDENIYCVNEDTVGFEVLPLTWVPILFGTDSTYVNTLNSVGNPPSGGTASIQGDTAFAYSPPADWNGEDTVLIQVCYEDGHCVSDTIFITVKPVDDPYIAVEDEIELTESDSIEVNITLNDINPDGGTITITLIDPPVSGDVSIDSTVIEYIPTEGFFGTDSLTYEVCNSFGACDTATIQINVAFVNDPPVAVNDSLTTQEDESIILNLIFNDFDPEGDSLNFTIISEAEIGTASIDNDSSILYTPNEHANGLDSVQYIVCDLQPLCDTAWVIITIVPVADSLVAVDDQIDVLENDSTEVDIVTNDINPDGGVIFIRIIEVPINGDISFDSTVIAYIPTADFFGSDSLSYEVCNSFGSCDTASLYINVEFVNEQPSVPTSVSVEITDTASVSIDPIATATDPDGDTLIIVILDDRDDDDVTIEDDGTVTYNPPDDFMLSDTVYYAVCDTHVMQLCDTSFIVFDMACPTFNHALRDDALCPDVAFSVTGTDIKDLTQYEWSFTDQLGIITTEPTIAELKINNPKRLALKSQRYGCPAQYDSINIVVRNAVQPPALDLEQIECEGSTVTLSVNEGNELLNYNWYDSSNDNLLGTGSELTINNLNSTTAGDYYTIASDEFCSSVHSSNLSLSILTDLTPPIIEAGDDQVICDEEITLNATASPGMPTWSTASSSFIAEIDNPTSKVFEPQIGENKFYWIQENQSCVDNSIDSVSIFYYPIPEPVRDSFFVELNEDYTLDLKANDEYYNLNVSITLINTQDEVVDNGDGTITVNMDGTKEGPINFEYEVCFEECPENCKSVVVNIHYEELSECDVPNVITPNGDGINDYLIIDCTNQYPQSSMIIFNRWGDEVYNNPDYDNTWNGMQDGKPLAAGTYFYILKVNDADETVDNGFIHVDR